MPTLVLRFPGRRYHATAIGHHVNEGVLDWPPSPWRLVRALLSSGYTTQRWTDVPPAARRLFDALCSVLPIYSLPDGALGHTRHYMPTTMLDKGRERTTLVLDTFVDVGEGELWVRWPTAMDGEAAALFSTLAKSLGYVGRSEAWVLGRAASDDEPFPSQGLAFPHVEGSRRAEGYEQILVVAPETPDHYAKWRSERVAMAIAELGPAPKKATRKHTEALRRIEEAYPTDVFACLHLDTAWWKDRQWGQPPGSRRVVYWRDARTLEVGPPPVPHRPRVSATEAMLLALTTPTGSRSALPTIARTLPQAERLHRALVKKLDGVRDCPELLGRDAGGRPLKGHRHAHLLPVDLDQDDHLDHVIVYAPMGLGAEAQRALRSIKRTYMKGGAGELDVAIAGQGSRADLRRLRGELGNAMARILGPPEGARRWISATPFVPPRHLKKRGSNTLEGQVQAELAARGLPAAATVEVLPWTAETFHLRHVVRRRGPGAPQPAVDAAFVLRLTLERPVTGPICLGYASHFGLGRFAVDPEGGEA